MSNRCARWGVVLTVIVAVCLFPGVSSQAIASPTSPGSPPSSVHLQDGDDDELPDFLDPNDDNDGTTDSDDPDPLDPVVDPQPTPGTIDSGADSDNDELPNMVDPDDDNDGAVDEDDAAPFVPVPETPPATTPETDPAPAPVAPETTAPQAPVLAPVTTQPINTQGNDAPPLVIALPKAGTGTGASHQAMTSAVALLTIGAATLIGMGLAHRVGRSR